MAEPVRVRFAPSPTGYLHVGGARTALFNWLFARHMGGTLVLRIEDTDMARSTEESVDAIFAGMTWLGLDWDEGPGRAEPHAPYFQTQRLAIYQKYADELLAAGRAYVCYRTAEELEELRGAQAARGETTRYDRAWSVLPDEVRAQYQAEGRPYVIRFKAPDEGDIVVHDILHGDVTFAARQMVDDFVIIKKDGVPTYNYAVVIDDATMAITHVIRGDDHLSNTPKQVAIYEALGLPVPLFCHIPMILGPDKAKLSKRHGTTSVMNYERDGFLPEALINYLVRLGWAHGDQEIFTRAEMIDAFTLEALNKTAAVFDIAKLEWLNAHYLKDAEPGRLLGLMRPHWEKLGLPHANQDDTWLLAVIRSLQERSRTLVQLAEASAFFFEVELLGDSAAQEKFLTPDNRAMLSELAGRLRALERWDDASLEPIFHELAAARGIKLGALIQPTRVAVTGKTASPGMYEVLSLLGRDLSLKRLDQAIAGAIAPRPGV